MIFFSSCKTDIAPIKNSTKTVVFYGESMLLREDITEVDVKKYTETQFSVIENARIANESKYDWSQIPDNVFFKFVNEALLNYPDLKKEIFDESDFLKLKEGLPNLKNKEEASLEKKSVVFEYINLLVSVDVQKKAKEFLKNNKGSKVLYTKTPTEGYCQVNDPLGAINVYNAANFAESSVVYYYGSDTQDNQANSFKHSVWNATAVKELCHQSLNKWTSLNRTKKFTCAHEYDPNIIFQKLYGNNTAMDLHNNLVGRTYMYETVGQTWLGNANNIPSYQQITSKFLNMSKTKKANSSEILALSSYYNWESLEDYNNAMNYNTSYNYPFTKEILVYLID